jgi:hypothetical protein
MNENTNLWIFLLVKYWDSEWTIRISWRNWKIIKYLEEMAIVRIPAANALIDNTVDVFTTYTRSRYWNEETIFIWIIA